MKIVLAQPLRLTNEELKQFGEAFDKRNPSEVDNKNNRNYHNPDLKKSIENGVVFSDRVGWTSMSFVDLPHRKWIENLGITFKGQATTFGFTINEVHMGHDLLAETTHLPRASFHEEASKHHQLYDADNPTVANTVSENDAISRGYREAPEDRLEIHSAGMQYLKECFEFLPNESHDKIADALNNVVGCNQISSVNNINLRENSKKHDPRFETPLDQYLANFHSNAFAEYAEDYPSENPTEWKKSLGFHSHAKVKQLIVVAQDMHGNLNAGVMAQLYPDGNVLVGFTPLAESIKQNPALAKQLIANMLKKLRDDLEQSGHKIGGIFMERPVGDDATAVMKRDIVALAGFEFVKMKDGTDYKHREPIWDEDEANAPNGDYLKNKKPILLAASWIGKNGQTFQEAVVSMTENYYNKDGFYGHHFAHKLTDWCNHGVEQDQGLTLAKAQASNIAAPKVPAMNVAPAPRNGLTNDA